MQPTEVRGRIVEKRCGRIGVDTDQAARGSEFEVRFNDGDDGQCQVEGVDLNVGSVEFNRINGKSCKLEDCSVVEGMKKGEENR